MYIHINLINTNQAPNIMKSSHRIILFVIIAALLIGGVFLFKDQLFVALSSIWAGAMILLGKLRNLFGGSEETTIEGLQTRLDDARKIERELIETLMNERQIYRDKLAGLQQQGREIDEKIAAQEAVLEDYEDLETWTENVWEEWTPEQREAEIEATFGEEIDLFGEFGYTYDDM